MLYGESWKSLKLLQENGITALHKASPDIHGLAAATSFCKASKA